MLPLHLLALVCITLASGFVAQERPRVGATVRVDVQLVTVPVHVTDRTGKSLTGLRVEDFQVYENGVLQEIRHFSTGEGPITLGILVDKSGSMAELAKIVTARYSAQDLVRLLRPDTEIFYAVFDEKPRLLVEPTIDRRKLELAISGTREAEGGTSLYDAIAHSLEVFRKASHPRSALVVITDGADKDSHISLETLIDKVREARVQLYTLACQDHPVFARLAEETGAEWHFVSPSELRSAVAAVAADIRSGYVLGYYAPEPKSDGLYRRIDVKVNRDHARVRSPRGYRLRSDR